VNQKTPASSEPSDYRAYGAERQPQPGEPGRQPPVVVRSAGGAPRGTYTLLGVTLFVFFLQMASNFLSGVDYPAELGVKDNGLIVQGELWRLLTPMFLHSTRTILHVAFNMYALYIFGPGLERHFGSARFLALYLLSGFSGNVISFLFTAAPSLGSSTAIFGLLGAQGAFLYQNRELFGQNARRALVNIITIAGVNLFIGLSPGIDNWGHIGGLVGGSLFSWFGGPLLHLDGVYPLVTLTDGRESGDVIRVGLAVGLLFAALAALKIFL